MLDASGDFVPLNLTGFTGVESPDLSIESTSDMNGLILRCVLNGCDAEVKTDSIPLIILENEPVYIPNCFTPNEDQVNAEFRLFTNGNPKLNASIYSRWGDLIFSWTDTNQGWNGKLNGEFVPEGMYVYKVRIETACETKNYTGRIQVIR
jgi:gliding motility-associated-like protein